MHALVCLGEGSSRFDLSDAISQHCCGSTMWDSKRIDSDALCTLNQVYTTQPAIIMKG